MFVPRGLATTPIGEPTILAGPTGIGYKYWCIRECDLTIHIREAAVRGFNSLSCSVLPSSVHGGEYKALSSAESICKDWLLSDSARK